MKSTPRQASETQFRPEIEGLRGLAVALVVAAHAGLQIPGAALGPDIFFALSGYLIVGILLRGLEAGHGISFRDFYARRIRRIAPALAATILLTVAVVALLNDPTTLARTAKDGAAALAGAANITFGLQAVDYFSSTEPSPLLPLWSIGVEEQFYLVVPLLLGAAWKIGGRRGILITLAVIAAGSTMAAVLLTPTEPIWAYYLLPTRAYGLAAGGLLALLETRALASNTLRRIPLAPIGLAMIAALTLLLPGEKGYPGIAGPLSGVASVALIGGAGWESADDWAALAASVVIAVNGVLLLLPAVADLMDRSAGADVLDGIRGCAAAVDGVHAIEKLAVRRVGLGYRVVVHVQADPSLSLRDAHTLGGVVSRAIHQHVSHVQSVVVHMEPFDAAQD